MSAILFLAVIGCSTPEAPVLALSGPDRLKVQSLGPVDGPDPVLSTGEAPAGLVWTAEPASVVVVEGDHVTAVGPGEATVTGSWQGQSVRWALVVDPVIQIVPVSPPARVAVGKEVPLTVEGVLDGKTVPPGAVSWSSSDTSLATVTDGKLVGVAPGIVYVTAKGASAEAMIEVEITVPEGP